MSEYTFAAEATSAASPDTVFAILADATGWKHWAGWFVRESFWEREGMPPPGGVGSIRKVGARPVYGREETVEYDPPTRFAYRILSGQPVKSYRADVVLTPTDTGTRIRWSGRFEPSIPGTGTFMRWYFQRLVTGFARRLAAYAERPRTERSAIPM
ncbi:MAG: SRPBCC family protein [Acidimicrobiia bacterium]|nr:SRPBCC family protein [Acidimicrobiia bacterium]